MANHSKRVDIENLLSLGADLIGVLGNRKDSDSLAQSLEGEKTLRSSCEMDSIEVQNLLQVHQKKIDTCKEGIEKAKNETIDDAKLEHLQRELEEKLQDENLLHQELRDELDDLERQRISIEERKEIIKKREKEASRAQDLLSMCASVTNIIPNLDDQTRISGFVVDRNNKKAQKFDIEPTVSQFEVCNRLWKMV